MYSVQDPTDIYPHDVDQNLIRKSDWKVFSPPNAVHDSSSPLYQNPNLYNGDLYNFSFAAQLHTVQHMINATQVDGGITGYFYTAYSAVPLAHTLRGYFNALDLPQPPILALDKPRITRHVQLGRIIKQHNLTRSVILDQYMNTGRTLVRATRDFRDAGIAASNIYSVGSRLYDQLFKEGSLAMDCEFADFDPQQDALAARFYRAGQQIAQQAYDVIEV